VRQLEHSSTHSAGSREPMLEPDFNPVPTAVQIGRCCYPASCRAPRCTVHRATIVLRKIDAAVVQFVKSSCAIAMPKALC